MDSMTDRTGCHLDNYHLQALKAIQTLMSTLDLIDIWQLRNPKKNQVYLA